MIVEAIRTLSRDQAAPTALGLARLVAEAEVGGPPSGENTPLYAPRRKIYPQSVHGTFRSIKWAVLYVTLGVYYLLPFLRWDRGPLAPHQAVLLDLPNRRFYFFFIEIWPQEVYYFTGLLILASIVLFLMNAVAGRVWCGYLCPQTVWTDVFQAIERLTEGDRRDHLLREGKKWTAETYARKAVKHFLWLMVAWWTGGAWVLYFADAPTLVKDLATGHAAFIAYVFIGILTFTTYTLAGHMREQVCLYMCPWPRIQAALTDDDALNVSYRFDRGEPRMSLKDAARAHAHDEPAGDCVDCLQCVAVCPTGIDIRNGPQLGCINCGLCIDACDAVMEKIKRPTRLIAYDNDENRERRLKGESNVYRFVRPRTVMYGVLIVLVAGIMLYVLTTRSSSHLSVLHVRAPLFTQTAEGGIRNGYTLRFSNKLPEPADFALAVTGVPGITLSSVVAKTLPDGRLGVHLDPDSTFETPVYVTTAPDVNLAASSTPLTFTAVETKTGELSVVVDHFFGP